MGYYGRQWAAGGHSRFDLGITDRVKGKFWRFFELMENIFPKKSRARPCSRGIGRDDMESRGMNFELAGGSG
jgi:hypothetical protein